MRDGVRETGEEEREGRGKWAASAARTVASGGSCHRRWPEVKGRTAARRPPESPGSDAGVGVKLVPDLC